MDRWRVLTKRAVLDVEHFRRTAAGRGEGGKRVFLFVGRLSPEKNLGRLIRAFGIAQREKHGEALELWIAGYGPMRSELEVLAIDPSLDGCVKFLGPIPQERLPGVYSRADVFILPSISETWGLVVNEAMCCELPAVVSSKCGCAVDLVNEETGWVVDPFDEQSIAEGILKSARTPRERLTEMGRAARQIAGEYSPHNCTRLVEKGLRQLISDRQDGRASSPSDGCPL
jgi:glycosyltransferase involved in cell wall biosynthesis